MTWAGFVVTWLLCSVAVAVLLVAHYVRERRRSSDVRRYVVGGDGPEVVIPLRAGFMSKAFEDAAVRMRRDLDTALDGLILGVDTTPLLAAGGIVRPTHRSFITSTPHRSGHAVLDRLLREMSDARGPSSGRYWVDEWKWFGSSDVDEALREMRREGAAQLQAGRLFVSLLADRTFKALGLDESVEAQFVRGAN